MALLDRAIARVLPAVPKPLVRALASPYIAGPTLEDAIAVVRRLGVAGEHLAQRRNAFQEGDCHRLPLGFIVLLVLARVDFAHDAVFVLQGAGELPRELVVQSVDQVADVVLDVADVQVLAADEAGVEDVEKIGDHLDNGIAAGQGAVAQMIDVPALGVRRHDGGSVTASMA